jgi:phosphoserine phosphatase RsbX
MKIEVAHVSAPKVGERVNGDAVFVRQEQESALFAVIDGLGHGPIAAEASNAALARLEATSLSESVLDTLQKVHGDLHRTRGAAATVCCIRGRLLETCAVGNVALLCANSVIPLVMSVGVLGHNVRKFRICSCQLKPGTRVALASDGISTRVRLDDFRQLSPSDACQAIFNRYRRVDDDATILIADMEG